jgi:WD40 repeat protein
MAWTRSSADAARIAPSWATMRRGYELAAAAVPPGRRMLSRRFAPLGRAILLGYLLDPILALNYNAGETTEGSAPFPKETSARPNASYFSRHHNHWRTATEHRRRVPVSDHAGDTYDIFLAYAAADRAWVEGYLLDGLRAAGIRCHSETGFALGVPRLEEFERAVRQSRRTVLVLSTASLADNLAKFTDLLAQSYGVETATWPVIPLLRAPVQLPPRLAMLTALDASDPSRWPTVLETICAELQRAVPGAAPRPPCPYPGMVPFRAEDARNFYGRTAEIEQTLLHLRYQRFLLVIGPSGSGKSSLITAGLLPQLATSGYFPEDFWLVREMHPGSQPLHELGRVLENYVSPSGAELVDFLAVHHPARRLLLVVDRFEEVFSQAERTEQDQFIAALKALRAADSCALILAMRADFYPDLINSALWPVDPSQRLELAPLRGEVLRQAIKQPATDAGVYLEAGLLERLLADAADEPGALPLIQETMVLLWGKMERRLLPYDAYQQLGGQGQSGLAVAMARKADGTLAALSDAQQKIARRIFLRLVQFGEGRADTRRQQSVQELRSAADDPLLFDQTLRQLADNRLLTLGGEEDGADKRVDIAHEMLIIGWPKSRQWVQSRREAELARRRLHAKADEWKRLGQASGGLLDEVELLEAERWLESPDAADLGYVEALPLLVKGSRARIEAEQTLARRRVRRVIASLAVGLALVAGLAVWGGLSAQTANREAKNAREQELAVRAERDRTEGQRRIALARQLAAQAELLRNEQPHLLERSVLLAVESMGRLPSVDAARPLVHGSALLPRRAALMLHEDAVCALAFSPEGKYLATASGSVTKADDSQMAPGGDSARLWEVASGREVARMVHGSDVVAVAFSPDGKLLSSGSLDRTARLWDVASRREVARMEHPGPVSAIAFSPDGKYLATASSDQTARVWEVTTGREVVGVRHEPDVSTIVFSPDGKYLATASGGMADVIARLTKAPAETTARVWDVPDGREVRRITHTRGVDALAFSPDSRFLATGSLDGTARVSEVASGREIARMTHEDAVRSVVFSPDGKYVASASAHFLLSSRDHTARVWEASSGREVARMTHRTSVWAVTFSPDGKHLATASQDQTARVWEASSGREVARMSHEGVVRAVAFSADGKHMATASGDRAARVWDWGATGSLEIARMQPQGFVTALSFNINGERLAAAGSLITGRVWEATSGREVARFPNGSDPSDFTFPSFSPDGRLLAATGQDKSVRVWQVPDGREFPRLPPGGAMEHYCFSLDGKYLAGGGQDGRARILELAAGREVVSISNESAVNALALSPEGKYVATATDNGTVRVSEIPAGKEVARMHHQDKVAAVVFNPDGKHLATASSDRTARLWDVTTGREIVRMTHEYPVEAVVFSPDGRHLATAGFDRDARIFEVPGGRELVRITHESHVNAIAFSHDGKYLATASGDILSPGDNVVRVWRWRPEDLIAEACSRLTRNLTWEEWHQYLGDEPYRKTAIRLAVHPSAVIGVADEAMSLVREGNTEAASLHYGRAVELAMQSGEPEVSNYVCWRGSLNGFPKIVLPAGEHAVNLVPDNGEFRDTRGLARALTGDYHGAIEDFTFFVEWSKKRNWMKETQVRNAQRQKREAWLVELRAGRNPFTPATLEALWDD